ncbi:MAG: hypothetical protein ACI9S8_001939 [Chlamydiales bacterium]|jgi:hypothetical protein
MRVIFMPSIGSANPQGPDRHSDFPHTKKEENFLQKNEIAYSHDDILEFCGNAATRLLDNNQKLEKSWRSSKELITRNIVVRDKPTNITYNLQVHTDVNRSQFSIDCSDDKMKKLGTTLSRSKKLWDSARKNGGELRKKIKEMKKQNEMKLYQYKRDAENFIEAFKDESSRISELSEAKRMKPLHELQNKMEVFSHKEISTKETFASDQESLSREISNLIESQKEEDSTLEEYRNLVISGLYEHALEESSLGKSAFQGRPDELMSVLTQTLQQGALAEVFQGTLSKLQNDSGLPFVTLTGQKADGLYEINLSRDPESGSLIGRLRSTCTINSMKEVYNKEFDEFEDVKHPIGKVALEVFMNYTENTVTYKASGFTEQYEGP